MKQPETNIEFITRIMDFSKNGALMQPYILEALRIYSERIKDADLSSMDNGMICPDAWRSCAVEALKELEERRS